MKFDRRPFAAWMNSLWVDHAVLRTVWRNFAVVVPGQWYRASHPLPWRIGAWVRRFGLRTIVNLRGPRECGSDSLSRAAARRLGIAHVYMPFESRGAPHRDRILRFHEIWRTVETPVLMHCKSGADRAGFMSTLFLLVHEKRPLDEAMRQLSAWYGHFKFAKTGILDEFFEQYRRTGLEKGIDFQTWIEKIYDPVALERDFKPNRIADWLVDRVLRRE